ncbi:trypsin-like peptidase domain-containing protein [Actinotalea sp. M2MS4P-6]|uniref:S1C family serine protease n=1 Tax=Actinotalea sp. M2MS4P-6 TaxID=2983762 RepID=UPI0021E46D26|nr:trypsin-like peptidase domain-containing protein [Actinotalea sp. M2MS4P-6]MCV2396488.1 trypsin-like peptidase domain-containing protein [Actinotalea sp. M2MS4P-6]
MHPSERPENGQPMRPQTAAPWVAPSGVVQTVAPTAQTTPPLASYPPVAPQYPYGSPTGQGANTYGPYPPAPPAPPAGGGEPPLGSEQPVGQTPPPPRRNRLWLPIVSAAAGAAVLASFGTAGLLGAFEPQNTTSVSLASLDDTGTSSVPVSSSSAAAPDWEAVAAAVRPSVVAIEVQIQGGTAEGSGVIIDSSGNIVTNNHVVADAVQGGITVTLSDGRVYSATVVGTDPTTDLAVIALTDPPSDLVPASIGDSDQVQVGEAVMAVGNPLGLSSTATTGIVSAIDRPVSTSDGSSTTVVTNAIQIDAAINPGNSGGPLFNSSGEVIGITSSIASLSQSSGSIGLGFAIPSNLVDRVAAELLDSGTASHAFLGVSLSDGTATADGVTRRGAVIEQITQGSPADDAGLQVGDVIVAIDSNPVNGAESLTGYVRELASGQSATLTVVRGGSAFDVDVTFAALSSGSQ